MRTVYGMGSKYYYPEDDEDEKMLKDAGMRKVVSGLGQGSYVR